MSDGARIAHWRATLRADHRKRLARKPGPVATANAAGVNALTIDRACKCGTIVCSKRGPCAPVAKREPSCDRCGHRTAAHCTLCDRCAEDVARQVAAPAAQPQAQGASEHAWLRVGMRVRCVDATEYAKHLTVGRVYSVLYYDAASDCVGFTTDGGLEGSAYARRFEPAEPAQPAASERHARKAGC